MENPSPLLSPTGYDLSIDLDDRPSKMVGLEFLKSVADGDEPFTAGMIFPSLVSPGGLVPDDCVVVRRHVHPNGELVLARGGGRSMRIDADLDSVGVWLSATDAEGLDGFIHEVRSRSGAGLAESHLMLHLWHWHPRLGPRRSHRLVTPPEWAAMEFNYPMAVRQALADLLSLREPGRRGRLVLWHGEAGTGKTNAVMALISAWSSWCDAHIVTDPERLFEHPDYMLEVMLQRASDNAWSSRGRQGHRWRLIVAEDADEYLRSDARRRSGPALGRLLNATDGIMGQGMNTVILLTTNDPVGRLHPAVTRPGRCLAVVEFDKFSSAEARQWLPAELAGPLGPATLAELFQLRDHLQVAGAPAVAEGAAYL